MRKKAVQGFKDSEKLRIQFMLNNMNANKAYINTSYDIKKIKKDFYLKKLKEKYSNYRKNWINNPKKSIKEKIYGEKFKAKKFIPLCVDIEIAAVCDLVCPFCFRQHIITPDKIMEEKLFYKIIDQCSDLGVPSIKLNWRGEPLLHPKLPEFIKYAKEKGILEVIINTNAVTLDKKLSKRIIEAGLDFIIYSFDGGNKETYEKMRIGRFKKNKFKDVYKNIVNFKKIKDTLNSKFPLTKIQMILTKDNFKIKSQFFKLFQNIIDDVSVKAYTERGGKLKDIDNELLKKIKKKLDKKIDERDIEHWKDINDNIYVSTKRLPCEQPFQRVLITYDGVVSMCCYDWGSSHPIGYVHENAFKKNKKDYLDVQNKIKSKKKGFVKFMDKAIMPESFIKIPTKVETLYEIWHGKIINDIRKEHINNNINNVEICKKCAFKETYKWEKLNI